MQSNLIRVLLVEDNENDAINIRYLLRIKTFNTYDVDWVPTYEAGREKLALRQHDIALFDYRLGEKTGIDLLRESKAQGWRIPIILLTGADNPEIDLEASSAGAADYLDKNSIDTSRLERAIRYSLRHSATLQALRESQNQLELFMKHVPCAIGIQDDHGKYLYVNDTFRQMVGREHEELIGHRDADIWPEYASEERIRQDREVLETLQARQVTEPVFSSNHHRHWLTSRFPMVQEDRPPMIGLAAIDITDRVHAEEKLRQTTQVLDGIINNLPVIAGRLDDTGIITEIAGAGLRRFGRDSAGWIGTNLMDLLPQFRDKVEQAIQGGSVRFSLEGVHDERPWHLENHFFFDKAQGRGAIFFSHDVTEQKELEKELLRISDEEQQRLGRDLHDGLGQHLTGIALLASTLQSRLRTQKIPEAEQAKIITEHVQDAIAQTRALSQGLCPVQLEKYGLQTALEGLAHNIKMLHEMDCQFECDVEAFIHDSRVAIHLYRIAQEAINNALKHGQPTRIKISLHLTDADNQLLIEDNGIGFCPEDDAKRESMGLRLMQYRAGMIGGALKIKSEKDKGTRITCSFPNLQVQTAEPSH
jgi:PAS domain S-box-containing protein